jgi:hypothetical protein
MSQGITQSPNSEPQAAPPGVANQLAIENGIEIYKITADWIRFADAKAAVVLAVAGTLAGLLIPQLKPYLKAVMDREVHPVLGYITLACFGLWFIFVLLSAIYAFLCIVPYRVKGQHPALEHCKHFHGAAIGAEYAPDETKRFIETYKALGPDGVLDEVLAGVLIDAHISSTKYNHVTMSIKLFFLSSAFGFLFLLLSQFAPAG